MNFSENIKDLGLLSELAYLKLENYEFSLNDIDNFPSFPTSTLGMHIKTK
jgi:hypothetical protein